MAKPTTSTMTTQVRLSTCPACKIDIMASVQLEVAVTSDIEQLARNEASLGSTITGMRVQHDCVRKVTR